MTVHFAAARSPLLSPVARILARRRPGSAANDNGETWAGDQMLHAALRHFAAHGMAAARTARKEAETAFFAGDSEGYQWWLGVCRTLDRRMAEEMARRADPQSA